MQNLKKLTQKMYNTDFYKDITIECHNSTLLNSNYPELITKTSGHYVQQSFIKYSIL